MFFSIKLVTAMGDLTQEHTLDVRMDLASF
jgi:hypothetical protein